MLDASAGRYEDINGANGLAEYLARPRPREDEEQLTEPILDELIRCVLGFPLAGYFPHGGHFVRYAIVYTHADGEDGPRP